MNMAKFRRKTVGLTKVETTFNVSIHEDNTGALILAKTFPP